MRIWLCTILLLCFEASWPQSKPAMEYLIKDTALLQQHKTKIPQLKKGSTAELAHNYKVIADYYYKNWGIDSLLHYYGLALHEYKKIKDSFYIYYCQYRIGEVSYEVVSNKEDLLRYFVPAADFFEREGHYVMAAHCNYVLSNIYQSANKKVLQSKHFDKARLLNTYGKDTMLNIIMLIRKAEELEQAKRWSEAIIYYGQMFELSKQVRNSHFSKLGLFYMGRAHYYSGNYARAIELLNENIRGQVANPGMQTESFRFLSLSYMQLGEKKKAEYFLDYYKKVTDSVREIQSKDQYESLVIQYEAEHKQAQIAALQRENSLKQNLADQQRTYIIGLVVLMILLLITAGIILINFRRKQAIEARMLKQQEEFSQRLHTQKEQTLRADFNKQLAEVQLTALSAQMNPHFIFNCMNSIQKYILKNEKDKALHFLQNFSELMRSVLDNSAKTRINLDEEINMLEKYIQLEQQRLDQGFDYRIAIAPDLQTDFFEVPSLVIQPYVENAIWHGLMNKNGKGMLSLAFSKQNGYIKCVVQDNGAGREHAAELERIRSPKRNSYGIALSKKRLELLQVEDGKLPDIEIEDLYDCESKPAGTRVTINMQVD